MTNSTEDSSLNQSDADTKVNQAMNSQRLDAEKIMESIVRISFAGLGGSIIGLGQKRRLESMRVLTGAAATAAARRKRSPLPQMNLPMTMAMSCMVFCGIIETSRLTSPSSILLQSQGYIASEDLSGRKDTTQSAMITVADFTLGGAIAGLAGSWGKTSQKRLLPVAAFQGSKRFFGLVPGIALGLAFGSLQAAADFGIDYLETASRLEKKN